VSYHDLLNNPHSEVVRIYRTLNLPNYDKAKPEIDSYLNSTIKYETNDYSSMDEKLKARLAKELYFEELIELQSNSYTHKDKNLNQA